MLFRANGAKTITPARNALKDAAGRRRASQTEDGYMRIVAEIAIDREPHELISTFVDPLSAMLQQDRLGRVTSHQTQGEMWVEVTITASSTAVYDRVLEFLAEANAPIGTIVYQVGWFGRKKQIVMLGQ
jgi:hypothetical protein